MSSGTLKGGHETNRSGGAVGNIIDRFQYGYVLDFLDFRVWPVFNVADSAISIGTAMLAIGLWRAKR